MIKNAILFDINSDITITTLPNTNIEDNKSVQPTALETVSTGFTKHPITKEYVSEFQGGFCLTVKTWKKEINKAAFKAKLEDRLERAGNVNKKEKASIQDQLLQEILPTILPKPSTVFMYYLHDSKKMIVDTTSNSVAESAISLLRISLGSLSAIPTMFPDDGVMLGNLEYCFGSDEQVLINQEVKIGDSIQLKGHSNQEYTLKNMDLFDEGVREELYDHITAGFKLKYIELKHVPNDVTFKLIDGYKLSNLSFDAFEGQGGSPESDWLTESYYMTSVIVNIVGSLNKLQPHTDSADTQLEYELDPLITNARDVVIETRTPTVSRLQRSLRIGYNRAVRLIEELEQIGVVSVADTSGSRKVLVE